MSLSFGSNSLTVYPYEPFSYTITNPDTELYTLSTTVTSGIPVSYVTTTNEEMVFASSSNAMVIGTTQTLTVSANVDGVSARTSVNTITIPPGRFVDSNGAGFVGSNYSFYAKEAITPIKFVGPFPILPPYTTPSLPPGLSFSAVDGSSVLLTGTPLLTSPQTNYTIIARSTTSSKVISSIIGIVISNERVVTQVNPSSYISNMQVDVPITPTVITSQANGIIRYTWPPFPDGIGVTDSSGVPQPFSVYGFAPTDPSHTMIITGAPTLAATNAFKVSNLLTQTILVERLSPAPVISSLLSIDFSFGETVLFEPVTVPPLYTGVTLDPSANYFTASTYFATSNVPITSIVPVGGLPPGLGLTFDGGNRAYLTGTPTSPGTGTYTIRATNSNLATRDIAVPITVQTDVVTLTTATPGPFTFVLSRPLDLSLTGYYPSPITFTASAESKKSIQWSASGLEGTGLSLSASSGSSTTLTGTPTTVTPLTNVIVTATATGTLATASRTVSVEIIDDELILSAISLEARTMIQNKPILPIQVTATALSGRTVTSFSASGLPTGLAISPTGQITGTPTTSGSFTAILTASTGFSNSSQSYSFTVIPDNMLIVLANATETVPVTFSGVPFRALSYSGFEGTLTATPSNLRVPVQGQDFDVSFSSGNLLQGDFSPLPTLLPKYRFSVTGTVGLFTSSIPVDVTVNSPPTTIRTTLGIEAINSIVIGVSPPSADLRLLQSTQPSVELAAVGYTYSAPTLGWTSGSNSIVDFDVVYGIHDIAQNGPVGVAVVGPTMYRSVDTGITWTPIPSSNITSSDVSGGLGISWPPFATYYPPSPLFGAIANDGTSNWVALATGTGVNGAETPYTIVRTSSDNGVTWTDTRAALGAFVTNITSGSKLVYNNSRYFAIEGTPKVLSTNMTPPVTTSLAYADASNPFVWTSVGDIPGVVNDVAFSNSTALAVGSNGAYISSNNGSSWAPSPTSPISNVGGDAKFITANYAHGTWFVTGQSDQATPLLAVSTSKDLVSWTPVSSTLPGAGSAVVEDGAAWILLTENGTGGITGLWDSNGNVTLGGAGYGGLYPTAPKRVLAGRVSTGTPTLTLNIPYDSSGITFGSPSQTSYLNWQFVPISPITVRAQTATPGDFIYYYASGLPDGLTFTPDSSGNTATIAGTSVRFSDAVQTVVLVAAWDESIAFRPLSMRTILPTVQKHQSSAGAWTSLVRQYTEVNGATTARDSKATPEFEYRLGEFTSPYPPSVVTAGSNCLC